MLEGAIGKLQTGYDYLLSLIAGLTEVPTRTELKELDTTLIRVAMLSEAGRDGRFDWRFGNHSALVAADTAEAVAIPADGIASTVGAWVRSDIQAIDVTWAGAKMDDVTDDSAAFLAADAVAQFLETSVLVPLGTARLDAPTTMVSRVELRGKISLGPSGSYVDANPLKISEFIARHDSHTEALLGAIQALFNSDESRQVLDGEGIELVLDGPCFLDKDDLVLGAGFKRVNKQIKNLNLRASGTGTWSAGDSLLYIAGEQGVELLRDLIIRGCTFDCNDIAGIYGLTVGGYYNIDVTHNAFIRFKDYAFRSLGLGDPTGNHGLYVAANKFIGNFSSPAGRKGMYIEDGDVVVRDNLIEWVDLGIKSMRGSIKIVQNHYSMNQTAAALPAVVCVAPRVLHILENDHDGCYIELTNLETNLFDNGNYQGWRDILIMGNEHTLNIPLPAGMGVYNFITTTANNFTSGLTIHGNSATNTAGGDVDLISFRTDGSGTWSDSSVAVINNPKVAGLVAGNFPGEIRLAENASAELRMLPDGTLRHTAGGSTARIDMEDASNGGANMPGVGSNDEALEFFAGGSAQWKIDGSRLEPIGTDQHIGQSTNRVGRIFLDEISTTGVGKITSTIATSRVDFEDTANAGTNMPSVGSSDDALQLRGGGSEGINIASTGNLDPTGSGAANLGSIANPWKEIIASTRVRIGGVQVVGVRGAAVADASGGATIDVEARAAINAALAELRVHGLIA